MLNEGTFVMTAAADWGTTGTGIFKNANGATLNKTGSGTTTVKTMFKNHGSFYILDGTAKFDHTADQGTIGTMESGVLTQLNGGNLTLANPGATIYNVWTGVFEGRNTVNGSLQNSGGTVKVGLSGTPHTLTITGNYYQTDGAGHIGSLVVYITNTGACSMLAVSGNVTLAGSVWAYNSAYTGIVDKTFMSYTNRNGTFSDLYLEAEWWNNGGHTYTFDLSADDTTLNVVLLF